jgi:hypothetical protein
VAGQLIHMPPQNNQIGWIIEDPDVQAFYDKLYDKYANVLKQEDLQILVHMMSKPEINDEIPF